MELRQQILKEHTKANCDKIVRWIGSNQERFDELVNLFLHDEYRVVQRAAWPLSYAVREHPQLVRPHLGKLIRNLRKPGLHSAVKRNTVRLLQDLEIPARHRGAVMNTCFDYITNPDEAVAVKAFSLTILGNLARHYPDIIPEIRLIIEENYGRETAAFKSRAKKLLNSPAFSPINNKT